MSSTIAFEARLQAAEWSRKTQKQLVQETPWGTLSGSVNKSNPLGNGEMDVAPEACIFKKVAKDGYKVVIPFQGKINTLGTFGKEVLLGNEASITTKNKEIFYGVERQAVALEDESIDGDLSRFYAIGSQKTAILGDYIAELNDYNHARAIMEGASLALTQTSAWATTSLGAAPVSVSLHSKVYMSGAATLPTWSTNYTTLETNIDDKLDAGTSADILDLEAANSIALLASRNLVPIGNGDYQYVAMISDEQAYQLTTGASNAWVALFKDASERSMKNKAITGAVGIYRGVLYVVNQRQPVWNLAASAGSKIVYRTPAVNSITRTVKGAANAQTGTCELAFVMGKGAIGVAEKEGVKYIGQKTDYDFNDGFAVQRKIGVQRMEYARTTEEPTQQSSLVYATATGTQSF